MKEKVEVGELGLLHNEAVRKKTNSKFKKKTEKCKLF